MAHAGKFYKVQFRRDLHLEFPNSVGWAEAYDVRQDGIIGVFGHFISSRVYRCINVQKNNQPPMVWQSPLYNDGGRDTYMKLTVPDPLIVQPGTYPMLVEIFRTFSIPALVAGVFDMVRNGSGLTQFVGSEPKANLFLSTGYDVNVQWDVLPVAAFWANYP